jgi:hypothetical protein
MIYLSGPHLFGVADFFKALLELFAQLLGVWHLPAQRTEQGSNDSQLGHGAKVQFCVVLGGHGCSI